MRTLTRWEPVADLATWNQQMDRWFNELMNRGLRRVSDEDRVRGSWTPAVNVLEKKDAIEITADLPGMKAGDVEVTVEDGVLTIRGERSFEEAREGETYHRIERSYGLFERTFSLPNSVDPSKIEATFKDGEMMVVLPRREEAKPRSVKIKVDAK
jgi:HSP20 family protein